MSNTYKNFMLFCYAAILLVGILMLIAMIIDYMITPNGATRTILYHMTISHNAVIYLSALLFIAVVAFGILLSMRLKPIQ